MSAQNTANSSYLVRQNVYSTDVLPPILPMLLNDAFVYDVSAEFSDGDTFYIPKMGMPSIRQRTQDEDSRIDNIPGTRFQMTIDEFPETAIGISRMLTEDSYVASQYLQQLMPLQQNAIMQRYETVLMAVQGDQTVANANLFDGIAHRFVGTGTGNVISRADFDEAAYALDTANVPDKGRIAIISPGMARSLKAEIGDVNVAFNRDFLGVPAESIRQGLDVSIDIGGFKVFVSNFAADIASETISGSTVTNGRAAMFFSVADDYVKPIARGWRRPPSPLTYIDYSKDAMEVYVVNARFGAGLMRPEALVVAIANNP